MENLTKKRQEIEQERKRIINHINLAIAYNANLDSRKINVQRFELELKNINKELKEVSILIRQHIEYPQEIKDLLTKAKQNYKQQIENIKNEYLKIKQLKERVGV